MTKSSKTKVFDFLIVYIIFISGSVLSYIYGIGLLGYSFSVLLPSIIFLLYKSKDSTSKVVFQGALLGFFAEIVFDAFGIQSKAWISPTACDFTIIGIPVENVVWTTFFAVLVLLFYEYFFDTKKRASLPKHYSYLLIVYALISIVMPLIYVYSLSSLQVGYYYAFLMGGLLIYDLFMFTRYKGIMTKAFLMCVYVFPLALIHEITSLENKHWFFEQGYHLFYIKLVGFEVPIEEFFFYFLAPMTFIIWYELLLDNGKS